MFADFDDTEVIWELSRLGGGAANLFYFNNVAADGGIGDIGR